MVRKSEAYNLTDRLIADDIGSGLVALAGEGATKSPRNLDSRGLNKGAGYDVENSTPAERGWRYWQGKDICFAG